MNSLVLNSILINSLKKSRRQLLSCILVRSYSSKLPSLPPPGCSTNSPVKIQDRPPLYQPTKEKLKYCVKPVQRVLYGPNQPKCKPKPIKPPPPGAKRINYCRPQDLRRICPPPTCTCPVRQPPETFMQMVKRYLKFLAKAALAGAIVLFTIDQGVWDEGDRATEIYQGITRAFLLMVFGSHVDSKKIKVPHTENMIHQSEQVWNKGVTVVTGFIATAPGYVINKLFPPKECPPPSEGATHQADNEEDCDDEC